MGDKIFDLMEGVFFIGLFLFVGALLYELWIGRR